MRTPERIITLLLVSALFLPLPAGAQNFTFKEAEAFVREWQNWLEYVGSNGSRYWVRLDSSKRPHKLYVGEGFIHARHEDKEEFIEIFSRFLAGHPERNMLIDIFDASTGKAIGEYGFGGFKLF